MFTDIITWQDVIARFIKAFGIISLRYLFFAGSLYFMFYVWKKREFFKIKIQQKYPENRHIIREIGYSFLSLLIFAAVGTGMFVLKSKGYTQMYYNFTDHSIFYFIFSVVAFIVIHDTYFYWFHRLMHWKKIYPYVHKVHHLSTNPTPWAAFAFHPIEAVIEVGIVPFMMFLMPLHPLSILVWVLYQTGMNVLGHLGFELFPSGFTTGRITRWHNTSVHHNMHHKHVTCNYGLYYNFWDRVMDTNHARYDDVFEGVKKHSSSERQVSEINPELETTQIGL